MDVKVLEHLKSYNKKSPLTIITQTKSNQILKILFFGKFKSYYIDKFELKKNYRVTGKLHFFSNSYQIIHPMNILNDTNFNCFENIEPHYNLSRKNINKKKFRKLVLSNLNILEDFKFPNEWIIEKYRNQNWLSLKDSLKLIHNPIKNISKITIKNLRKRLAYDELLANLLVFQKLKKKRKENNQFKVLNFNTSSQLFKI